MADFRGIVSLLLTRTPTSFHHTTLLPFITTLLSPSSQPCFPSSQPYSPLHHNPASLHYTTLLSPSSLYPTNKPPRFSQTNQLTTTSFNLFPPKSARCSSVCFQTTDTASQSSPPSLPPPHFDASNSLAAAPSARLRTPSATPSRSTQSPLSFAAPAFYSVNSLSLPCFGTNCSWFVRMSRRREVVHFPNFILK